MHNRPLVAAIPADPPPSSAAARRPATLAASVWTWLIIGLATVVAFVLQVLLWPSGLWDRHRRLSAWIFRQAAVSATRLTPLWHFRRLGGESTTVGRTVVISNHVSHLDAFLIARVPWEMKWLAKSSLFRVPFLGWGMRLAGDLPVVRGARASVAVAMARAARLLAESCPVFVFPEGTRATEEGLLPFKEGAFRLAIESGAQVLPLAVAGTRQALPKQAWRFARASALVMVGRPIGTDGPARADAAALADTARAQVEAMLAAIRPVVAATPPGRPFAAEQLGQLERWRQAWVAEAAPQAN